MRIPDLLDVYTLQSIRALKEKAWGNEILTMLGTALDKAPKPAKLRTILQRLDKEGYIVPFQGPHGLRYELTEAGSEWLHATILKLMTLEIATYGQPVPARVRLVLDTDGENGEGGNGEH